MLKHKVIPNIVMLNICEVILKSVHNEKMDDKVFLKTSK